ncbi:protein CLT1, chloroplastic isoform X3 [Elaeis guineensis]|uniref:protein CLT1, chloroplastic isoform X3 n=1 Tax=Elaeis guineensis var. tenera TaxID=51953 RepID=UPI003C6D23BB
MSAFFRRAPNLQIPSPPSNHRLWWSHHHHSISPCLTQPRDAIAVSGALRSLDPRSGIRFLDPVVLRSADGRPRRRRGSVVRGCALGGRVGDVEVERRRKRRAEVVAAAAMTALLGTGNRVLYKLALVPLKQYPFFLAQLATFGYVVVYFSILYARYHSGIVTNEMLSLPKTPYLAVGLLEALAAVSGMAAGAVLSGASIPILSQTFLVWQLLLSVIFLGRRYRFNQILGCFLVTIGVIITVASGSGAGDSLKNAGIFWTLLMIISFLFQAADTVLKYNTVVICRKQYFWMLLRNWSTSNAYMLQAGSVDLFVVNSFGSAFQALFICLLLPFLSKLWGVPFNQLPTYIKDGAACFLNIGSLSSGCEGAPVLPLLFVIVNMAFNISLLHLLKISSAVVSCLASTFSVFTATGCGMMHHHVTVSSLLYLTSKLMVTI